MSKIDPIRVVVHGATGRMGQALLRLAPEFPALQVVAAVGGRSAPVGLAAGIVGLRADQLDRVAAADVVIDFSLPEGVDALLRICRERGLALVSGTTGLSPGQKKALAELGDAVPVLWAANFSLGVAVLADLVRRASAALPEWQVQIVETHHIHKKDAPSGTALQLGREVAGVTGREPGYRSLREGEVVGEHVVTFAGAGERVELAHRAGDRDIFARGALTCAQRLSRMAPGSYRIGDVLGLGD